jgi:hypothetical protein
MRLLEHRALNIWTARAGKIHRALLEAVRQDNRLGLKRQVPPRPICSTPACYRAVVERQTAELRRLRQMERRARAQKMLSLPTIRRNSAQSTSRLPGRTRSLSGRR